MLDIHQLLYFLIDFRSVVTEVNALDVTVDGDIHVQGSVADIVGFLLIQAIFREQIVDTFWVGLALKAVGCCDDFCKIVMNVQVLQNLMGIDSFMCIVELGNALLLSTGQYLRISFHQMDLSIFLL